MKNCQWLSKVSQSMFGKKTRNTRRRIRKRALAIESLEQRNLLATVSFDAGFFDSSNGGATGLLSFQADAGEADVVTVTNVTAGPGFFSIQVGAGDSIVLEGDALENADFVISQTVLADDTLTISNTNSLIAGSNFNLGDLDDTFTATSSEFLTISDRFVVDGGDGSDTLDASAVAVRPVLFAGVTLRGGSGDDVLTGGTGADELFGNDGNDTLSGRAGNDILEGGGGTDVINGGVGIDFNSFASIGFGVTATISADGSGSAEYGAVSETFNGIENLIGSAQDDVLTGNDSDNLISGGAGGNDTISGLGGDDVLSGGGGDETGFSLSVPDQSLTSLTTDQTPAELVAEAVAGDLYFSVRTSSFATGDGEIRGQLSLDSDSTVDGVRTVTLTAALDSAQVSDSNSESEATGEGSVVIVVDGESVTYSADLSLDGIITSDVTRLDLVDISAISINNAVAGASGPAIADVIQDAGGNLSGNTFDPQTGFPTAADTGDGDVFVETFDDGDSIVNGGDGNDSLSAGAGNDVLNGGAGDDVISAGRGDDTLEGGEGNDSLFGGLGDDTLLGGDGDDVLTGDFGSDIIEGGAGFDTNAFEFNRFGVTATIENDGTGIAQYGFTVENFSGIEGLRGSGNNDVLTGNDLDNLIVGGLGFDMIFGLGGDDILVGNDPDREPLFLDLDGSDIINGGAGNDTISDGAGNDILRGGPGDDFITGGEDDDTINGGAGDDRLSGGDGNDFFVGIGGTDSINGGDGFDVNSFQGIGVGVTATVNGDGTGTATYGDVTETFVGIEDLTGSENDDVLRAVGFDAGFFGSVLRGLGGNDVLIGSNGDDFLVGNAGNDILRGGEGDDRAIGGPGNDNLNGGAGNDFLSGEAGDDFFVGIGGTDTILGGEGFDTNSFQGVGLGVLARINDDGSGTAEYGMVSEAFMGIDRLVGSSNDDTLIATGSRGTRLLGLDGDDLLIGGFGNDVLAGGLGNDTLNARGGNDQIFGNQGNDTINAGDGDDFARGDEGDDFIAGGGGNDRLAGSQGNDRLFGGDGLDFLFGAAGDDELIGGDDDDELRGGEDDDLLIGGLGVDLLVGGNGDDEEIQ